MAASYALNPSSSTASSSKAVTPAPSAPPSLPRRVPIFTHTSQYSSYYFPSLPPILPPPTLRPPIPSTIDNAAAELLQNYYLSRLPLLAKAFGFNERILATAMTYFKRFWLPQSGRHVAEPFRGVRGRAYRGGKGVKLVMLISLFLSTKTHSTSISLSQFSSRVTPAVQGQSKEERQRAIEETSTSILQNEFEVASVLCWRFRVLHAFEGVRGIAIDLQRRPEGTAEADVESLGKSSFFTTELLDRVKVKLDFASQVLRLTAAEFLYTPSQLALGTWWYLTKPTSGNFLEQEEKGKLRSLLQQWIHEREDLLASSSTSPTTPPLLEVAEQITKYIDSGIEIQESLRSPSYVEAVKAIDLQIRSWAAEREKEDLMVVAPDEEDDDDEDGRGSGAVRINKRKDAPDEGGQEEGNLLRDETSIQGVGSEGASTAGGGGGQKRIKVIRGGGPE